MLLAAGLREVSVVPKLVYVDGSRPDLVEGVAGLHRAAEHDGVFCYTFFKATGIN